ncbi:MAG: aminopeptidase P family protein [Anaerolineae bacterium]|nr:aminopeptidase P family protein [Anaerolineae bacterium]
MRLQRGTEEMTMRLDRVREALGEHGVDALLISQPENRRYLSGFTGSAGYLLILPGAALLATDFRYYEQVRHQAPNFELARITDRFADLLPGLVQDLGIERLGFEAEHVTVDELRTLSSATDGLAWVPVKQVVEKVRAVKDGDEIEAIRRSVALTDAALAHFLEVLEPGMTERQAAWEIEKYMREHGASKVAFDLIVAAGPNGALPHARPGDREIVAGEPIVVDIGAVVDGYASDMTRTVCLGEPAAKYLEVWQIVLRAQEAAEAAIRAGTTGREADAIARDVITQAGYGDYFGHGLGHGVGLAVHEAPRAGRLSQDTLQAGMTLTVEPGIYLPGEFGVRIEDLVLIRDDGVDILTQTPKQPVVH